jgi:Carboxypeptidase regulatory-like domain
VAGWTCFWTSLAAPGLPSRLRLRQRLSVLGLPLVLAASIFTAWLAPVQDAQASGSCTDTSAWGVKVGADPNAANINMGQAPTTITVNQLATIPLPVPVTHRVQPTETTIYRTTAVLNTGQPKVEYDNDTHLAFNDGQPGVPGHFAIAELPNLALGNGTTLAPHPIPPCSPFYAGIQNAHQQLDAWTAAANHGPTPPAVVITGVGFFDGYTGQADQSANQIELHSVLDLNINPGSITGRITDSGGLGLAGATVSDGVDPAAVTDGNGQYTIPNVRAGAGYSVTASDSGFISFSIAGVAVGYASPSPQNFSLMPNANGGTGAVSGTVTSTLGGIAVAGARVTDSSSGGTATTDNHGNYTLANLAPGSHSLTASAATFTTSQLQLAGVTAGQTSPGPRFSLAPITGGYSILNTAGGIYSFGDATYWGNLIDHRYPGPAVGLAETPSGHGYNILTTAGAIYSFGDANYFGNLLDHRYPGPATALSYTPNGGGYAILNSAGGIYTFGDAGYYGNLIDHGYPGTAVGLAYTSTGNGYWILTTSGALYSFGDATYFGNLIDHGYRGVAASVSAAKDGSGYAILTTRGAVYRFGSQPYLGSLLDHLYPGPAAALSNTP